MTRFRWILLIAVGVLALAWAVERLIVTDGEAIEALLEGQASVIVRGEWDALEKTIVEDYDERGKNRAGLVSWVRDTWQRSGARSLDVHVEETRVEGDRARARVTVSPGMPFGGMRVSGSVELRRTEDGWRIASVAPDDSRWLGP